MPRRTGSAEVAGTRDAVGRRGRVQMMSHRAHCPCAYPNYKYTVGRRTGFWVTGFIQERGAVVHPGSASNRGLHGKLSRVERQALASFPALAYRYVLLAGLKYKPSAPRLRSQRLLCLVDARAARAPRARAVTC